MKLFNKLVGLSIFSILIFSSCRDELIVETGTNSPQVLAENSMVANLMRRTSLNDGSNDNIIDNANCFSLQLPVTISINGLELTIDSEEDFLIIEAIFDEFDNDIDELEIVFPITIILSDFSEIVINTGDELEDFLEDCNGENEFDDDIECIDFQYPLTGSVFNTITELTERVTINSDQELHDFIENLTSSDVVNIDFPITVILFDGTEITVNDLNELEIVIRDAEDDCDEDDDFDFNDDDCENCTEQQVVDLLTGCTDWIVDKLELNGNDLEDNYENYVFNFSANGTLTANDNTNNYSGTWSATGSGENITVIINIPNLSDFNASWNVHELEDEPGEHKVDLRLGDDRLRFESSCN